MWLQNVGTKMMFLLFSFKWKMKIVNDTYKYLVPNLLKTIPLFSNIVKLMQYIRFYKLSYLHLLFESVLNFISFFFLNET